MAAKMVSLLLASKNPARLRDFYATAFDVKADSTPGQARATTFSTSVVSGS